MVSKHGNYFDGLRTFPRDPNELRQHSAKLNYILQKRYHLPAEVVKLALNPQNAEDFNRYYRQQVTRIIANFNAVTQKQLKVRVDSRLAKGMQLACRDTVVLPIAETKAKKKMTEPQVAARTPPVKKATAYLTDVGGSSDLLWDVGAQEGNKETHLPQTEGQQTPKTASSSALATLKGICGASDDLATVSSDDYSTFDQYSMKKKCRDVVFSTPPEFKGFTVPLQASPADSFLARSPLLL